jgi:hypothetical protein
MIKPLKLLDIDLRLFDGEGGAPSGDGGQSADGGVASPTSNVDPKNVVYGKDVDTSEDGPKEAPPEIDPEVEFEELIKTKYKDQFAKRTQSIIDKRFKEVKTLEKQASEFQSLVDVLGQKYGTDDPQVIRERMESEIIEELAYQNDMSPENYRKIMEADKIRKQNDIMETQRQQQEQIQAAITNWTSQAEQMKGEYPDFDLRTAMQDDQFLGMIKSNVPVKTAYEILHIDKLKEQIRREAETKTAQNIQAKRNRPSEAASKGVSGAVVKNDVKSLTKKDREEIARRVQRGEKITF